MVTTNKNEMASVQEVLDALLGKSYENGYLSGAVAAAVGDIIVEKRNSGYFVRSKGEQKGETADVAESSTTESK